MHSVKISTVTLNQTPLQWKKNRQRITDALKAICENEQPSLVLYPELSLTGCGCEDAFFSPDTSKRAMDSLAEIVAECKNTLPNGVLVVGLPLTFENQLLNCAAIIHGGEVCGIVPKINPDKRWFGTYPHKSSSTISLFNKDVRIGKLMFHLNIDQTDNGERFCFLVEVGDDANSFDRPARIYKNANLGFDAIVNPIALPFEMGRHTKRVVHSKETSLNFQCSFVSVNLLGNEAGSFIYDGASIAASSGDMLFESNRFSFDDWVASSFNIPCNSSKKNIIENQNIKNDLNSSEITIITLEPKDHLNIKKEIEIKSKESKTNFVSRNASEFYNPINETKHTDMDPRLEFLYASSLALFDYMRKSKAKGYVLSLSGGRDSAACLLLVSRMILFSLQSVGAARTLERLNRLDILQTLKEKNIHFEATSNEGWIDIQKIVVPEIISTLYQATENSSVTTKSAARQIANALYADHSEVSMEHIVQNYMQTYSKVEGRHLNPKDDDITMQNIQARTRSPLIWMLANAKNYLLICTSNRSETTLGYCTVDGDTSGGLSPLAGVSKVFIKEFLLFMEIQGDDAGGCVPELRSINSQTPTAELRPLDQQQSDEDDLMPYPLLDDIENLLLVERLSPLEILQMLTDKNRSEYRYVQKFSYKEIINFIIKFFKLFSASQWKREKSATLFHLDGRNLNAKTGCRFPVLNSGYADELEELQKLRDNLT